MTPFTDRLTRFLAVLLLLGGVTGAWRFYQQVQVREIPILMYHRIGDEGESVWWVRMTDFESHMRFLKEQGYRSIFPSDLVAHQRWGKPLPKKPIIITFDDGYLNSLQNAEPIMKKYGFRGVVYLVTGKVADRSEERKTMEGTPTLTWPEVREMHRRGTLTFGGHTRSHVNLGATKNPYPEIRGCYKDIRKKGGFTPAGFCYPNGEYYPETIPLVKKAGFSTAVTCHAAFIRTDKPISFFELPRASVYGGRHVYRVEVLTNTTDTVSLKVRKEGSRVTSIPRLASPALPPHEGWLAPVRISTEPVILTWSLSREKLRSPVSFELWGDLRILPHWRQEVMLPTVPGSTP
jgi:peptidoglycan/xylan/chitin deacetylase (PgdA/CDA1 family)